MRPFNLAVLGFLALGACAAGGAPARDQGSVPDQSAPVIETVQTDDDTVFQRYDGPPIAAAARSEIDSAVGIYVNELIGEPKRTRLSELELLRRSAIGERFAAARKPRALVVGDPPESCRAFEISGGADGADAVRAALQACVANIGAIGEAAGADCRCRLAVVDEDVFAGVEYFRWRERVQTYLLWRDPGTGKVESRIGLADIDDRGDGFKMVSPFGAPLCEGRLATAAQGYLAAAMSCEGVSETLTGRATILGNRAGRLYAVARLADGDLRATLMIGHTDVDFRAQVDDEIKRLATR